MTATTCQFEVISVADESGGQAAGQDYAGAALSYARLLSQERVEAVATNLSLQVAKQF